VIRTAIVLIAAALLGGCFYSDDALIGRFAADFPLEDGVYTHTPNLPDGRPFDRPAWTGEIRRRGGRYVSDQPDFPHDGTRLRELSPGVYAAMREREDQYEYGIVFVYPGNVAAYHQPKCQDLDPAVLDTYDVVEHPDEPGYCRVDDWDRLSGVLLSYIAAFDGDIPIDGVYRRVE